MNEPEDDSYQDIQDTKMQTYSMAYELIVSVLYVWSGFEAYTYDAKLRSGEVWLYIAVYVVFAVFVRSYRNIVMMNILAAFSLPVFLMTATIHKAGSYFDFQPFLGWIALMIAVIVQALIFSILKSFLQKYMSTTTHLKVAGIAMILFTVIITVLTIVTPGALHGNFS